MTRDRWLRATVYGPACWMFVGLAALNGCATLSGARSSAEDLIEAGDRAFQARRYDEAAASYGAAERSPAHRGVVARKWMAMGEFFERTGHETGRQHAHRYYKRAIAADPTLPGPRLARARMLLGGPEWKRQQLDPDRVLRFLNEEERLAPGRPEVASLKADALRLDDQKAENNELRARAIANAGRGWRSRDLPTTGGTRATEVEPQEQTVGEHLVCTLAAFRVWGAPGRLDPSDNIAAVRLRCRNPSETPARLKAADVSLITANGTQVAPDERQDNFELVFDAPAPQFVARFVDVAPGSETELGFTFTSVLTTGPGTDSRMILDADGARYSLPH